MSPIEEREQNQKQSNKIKCAKDLTNIQQDHQQWPEKEWSITATPKQKPLQTEIILYNLVIHLIAIGANKIDRVSRTEKQTSIALPQKRSEFRYHLVGS